MRCSVGLLAVVALLGACAQESLVPEGIVSARCADGTTRPAAPGDPIVQYHKQCGGRVEFLDASGRVVLNSQVLKTVRSQ